MKDELLKKIYEIKLDREKMKTLHFGLLEIAHKYNKSATIQKAFEEVYEITQNQLKELRDDLCELRGE